MSLARLLAAGKSVVGLRPGETRYRMHSNRLLPRFGSARNPFEARSGEPAPVFESPAPIGQRVTDGAAGDAAPLVSPGPSAARPAGAEEVVSPKTPAVAAGTPAPCSRWQRLKARFARASGRRGLGGGQSPFRGAAVQSELKLDAVKVVRNDLTGAGDDLFGHRAMSRDPGSETLEFSGDAAVVHGSERGFGGAGRPPVFAVRNLFGLWPKGSRERERMTVGASRQRA